MADERSDPAASGDTGKADSASSTAPPLPLPPEDSGVPEMEIAHYVAGEGDYEYIVYDVRKTCRFDPEKAWDLLRAAPLWMTQLDTVDGPVVPQRILTPARGERFDAVATRLRGWVRMDFTATVARVMPGELLHFSIRAFPRLVEFESEVEARLRPTGEPGEYLVIYRQAYPTANWVSRANDRIQGTTEAAETHAFLRLFTSKLGC